MKCINEKCDRGLWTEDGCLFPSENETCVDFIPEPKQAEAVHPSTHTELLEEINSMVLIIANSTDDHQICGDCYTISQMIANFKFNRATDKK